MNGYHKTAIHEAFISVEFLLTIQDLEFFWFSSDSPLLEKD